jgi:GntR family transcriptional regulator
MEAPRYLQILNVLSQRVENGEYPVEERLPTENELCEEFGASRFTVREALRRMVEKGMVQRRQGAGTVVVAASPQARYVQSVSSLADLSELAHDTDYELLSHTQVSLPAIIAGEVGGKPGARWSLLRGLRRSRPEGNVLCYMHTYIPQRIWRYMRAVPNYVGPLHVHLSELSGEPILEVEQDLRGELMNRNVASMLGQKFGTVSMCILRRYVTPRGTLLATYNWHVAADFHYRTKVARHA